MNKIEWDKHWSRMRWRRWRPIRCCCERSTSIRWCQVTEESRSSAGSNGTIHIYWPSQPQVFHSHDARSPCYVLRIVTKYNWVLNLHSLFSSHWIDWWWWLLAWFKAEWSGYEHPSPRHCESFWPPPCPGHSSERYWPRIRGSFRLGQEVVFLNWTRDRGFTTFALIPQIKWLAVEYDQCRSLV